MAEVVEVESGDALLSLPGIGPATAQRLAEAGLTTLDKLRSATLEELCAVEGIGKKTAERIIEAVGESD